MKKTRYQRTNKWIARREVQCDCRYRDRAGRCRACGQRVSTDGPHKPGVRGGLGWIHEYANGSVYVT